MNVSKTLMQFAKAREHAYRSAGTVNMAKMRAISKIIALADFVSHRSEPAQLRAIRQVEPEILMILPHEQSRFHRLRNKMLTLIQQSHD